MVRFEFHDGGHTPPERVQNLVSIVRTAGTIAQRSTKENEVSNYEVVIVQERYDIDPDVLAHLSSDGRRLSIVRPHVYDVINRVALNGYCAIARNQATELGEGDWVVFLSDGSDPAESWFVDLERDLEDAETRGAAVTVAADVLPEALRVRDIAYRRDVLSALGGFSEDDEDDGTEDFLAELELVAAGFSIAQGTRCCGRSQ